VTQGITHHRGELDHEAHPQDPHAQDPAPRPTGKTPKAKAPVIPVEQTPEAPAPRPNLEGITLTIGAFKKPDCYRPYVRMRFPDGVHDTKLVPQGRTATRDEALAKAQAYRAQIHPDDRLPPRPDRFVWKARDLIHIRADDTLVTD